MIVRAGFVLCRRNAKIYFSRWKFDGSYVSKGLTSVSAPENYIPFRKTCSYGPYHIQCAGYDHKGCDLLAGCTLRIWRVILVFLIFIHRISCTVFAAIFGQQLFMGKMINCNDALIFRKDQCVGNMSLSGVQRRWIVLDNNFGIFLRIIYRLFLSNIFCHRLDRSVIVLSVSSGDFRFLV